MPRRKDELKLRRIRVQGQQHVAAGVLQQNRDHICYRCRSVLSVHLLIDDPTLYPDPGTPANVPQYLIQARIVRHHRKLPFSDKHQSAVDRFFKHRRRHRRQGRLRSGSPAAKSHGSDQPAN